MLDNELYQFAKRSHTSHSQCYQLVKLTLHSPGLISAVILVIFHVWSV